MFQVGERSRYSPTSAATATKGPSTTMMTLEILPAMQPPATTRGRRDTSPYR